MIIFLTLTLNDRKSKENSLDKIINNLSHNLNNFYTSKFTKTQE